MTYTIDELEKRVESYFDTGQKKEPAGRLILDLMRALREQAARIDELEELPEIEKP